MNDEASVALNSIAIGRTALEGHYIGPPPTLLPTLLMFHGRFQRLVLARRNSEELLIPTPLSEKKKNGENGGEENEKNEENKTGEDVHNESEEKKEKKESDTGSMYIDMTIQTLESSISLSIQEGGHDHLLLRASLLELCSLYGAQLIPSVRVVCCCSEKIFFFFFCQSNIVIYTLCSISYKYLFFFSFMEYFFFFYIFFSHLFFFFSFIFFFSSLFFFQKKFYSYLNNIKELRVII